jgi:hypothetical protein
MLCKKKTIETSVSVKTVLDDNIATLIVKDH